jgi:uncharacterized protein (TIGR04255 family)
MKYPDLGNTPIKEIIFSVSYREIFDKDCFEKFIKLNLIKSNFPDVKPSVDQEFKLEGNKVSMASNENGFHLRNKNEVLQLRKGSFSYHHLNGYKNFSQMINTLGKYWESFDSVTKDDLTITDFSVRYINVIETDDENQPTHLVQLYPKQSDDRNIINFQNSIQFNYKNNPDYIVNAVSTKLNQKGILLDISVKGKTSISNNKIDLIEIFQPLQEIKNKAFFDSITARALLKYMDKI